MKVERIIIKCEHGHQYDVFPESVGAEDRSERLVIKTRERPCPHCTAKKWSANALRPHDDPLTVLAERILELETAMDRVLTDWRYLPRRF